MVEKYFGGAKIMHGMWTEEFIASKGQEIKGRMRTDELNWVTCNQDQGKQKLNIGEFSHNGLSQNSKQLKLWATKMYLDDPMHCMLSIEHALDSSDLNGPSD